jgi:hypothetical protein
MPPSDIEVFHSVVDSNMPLKNKTAMQRIMDRVTNGRASEFLEKKGVELTLGHEQLHALGRAARGNGESFGTGALLGYIDEKVGLSPSLPVVGTVAIDGSVGVLSSLTSILLGNSPLSTEALNISNSCFSVYGFRKVKSIMEKKTSTVAAHGEETSDPILKVARSIK